MPNNKHDYQEAAITFAAVIGGFVLTAFILFLIYSIRGVLPPFLYALIIVYLLRPVVNFFVSRNLSRMVAVSLTYLIILLLLTVLLIFLIPLLITQTKELLLNFPQFLKTLGRYLTRFQVAFYQIELPKTVQEIFDHLVKTTKNTAVTWAEQLPQITVGFFGGLFNVILAPIIAFYILKDLPAIKETVVNLVPLKYRDNFLHLTKEIDIAVGGFLRGQLLVALIVGVTISIYLLIIGVNFAILLGLLAGILNIIPYFGPIIGGTVAALVALFQSPTLALLVVIGMLVIQQLDGVLISPNIMRQTVNLHPVVIILALLIGGSFFGFLGLVLAIPVAAVGKALLIHYFYEKPKEPEKAALKSEPKI